MNIILFFSFLHYFFTVVPSLACPAAKAGYIAQQSISSTVLVGGNAGGDESHISREAKEERGVLK